VRELLVDIERVECGEPAAIAAVAQLAEQNVLRGAWNHVARIIAARVRELVELEVRVRIAERRLQAVRGLRDQRELESVAARLPGVDVVVASGAAGHLERNQLVVDLDREQRELVAMTAIDQPAKPELDIARLLRVERRIEAAAAARIVELGRG